MREMCEMLMLILRTKQEDRSWLGFLIGLINECVMGVLTLTCTRGEGIDLIKCSVIGQESSHLF